MNKPTRIGDIKFRPLVHLLILNNSPIGEEIGIAGHLLFSITYKEFSYEDATVYSTVYDKKYLYTVPNFNLRDYPDLTINEAYKVLKILAHSPRHNPMWVGEARKNLSMSVNLEPCMR